MARLFFLEVLVVLPLEVFVRDGQFLVRVGQIGGVLLRLRLRLYGVLLGRVRLRERFIELLVLLLEVRGVLPEVRCVLRELITLFADRDIGDLLRGLRFVARFFRRLLRRERRLRFVALG